jgi:uncharacterized Zn-binding protein involved in type VI secretion
MGQPAAKQNDNVVGIDVHIVMVPAPPGPPVPTPLPHAFSGPLDQQLSSDVFIDGLAAATKDSVATNRPSHIPTPPGVSFQSPPPNRGTVTGGSATVNINGKPAARVGDLVDTCNDIGAPPSSAIVGTSTVFIG